MSFAVTKVPYSISVLFKVIKGQIEDLRENFMQKLHIVIHNTCGDFLADLLEILEMNIAIK